MVQRGKRGLKGGSKGEKKGLAHSAMIETDTREARPYAIFSPRKTAAFNYEWAETGIPDRGKSGRDHLFKVTRGRVRDHWIMKLHFVVKRAAEER